MLKTKEKREKIAKNFRRNLDELNISVFRRAENREIITYSIHGLASGLVI